MSSSEYAAAMAALTAARTEQMCSTCLVVRPADPGQEPELDADNNLVPAPDVTVYDGPCTVADPTSTQITGRTTNDESGVPYTRTLRVPHEADLRPGDLVTVTADPYSPGLVGDRFTVLGEEKRTFATHRRYALRGSSWLPS